MSSLSHMHTDQFYDYGTAQMQLRLQGQLLRVGVNIYTSDEVKFFESSEFT